MIILDNIIFSLQKAGGISNYWAEICKRFKSSTRVVFYEKKNKNLFRKTFFLDQTNSESILPTFVLRYLPFQRNITNNTIFHSSYYRYSNSKEAINIVTVHDFIYEKYMKGYKRLLHSLQKSQAINKADGIICVSEVTKKDLLNYFPNIDINKIIVIYHGVSDFFFKIKKIQRNPKFKKLYDKKNLIYIGDRNKYKNFNSIVKFMNSQDEYHLIIIGGGNLTTNEKKSFQKKNFSIFQNLSSKDLNHIYNIAVCLIYPSRYEGFGIPLVEAMKSSCPIIAMNTPISREITDGSAILIDDFSIEEINQSLIKIKNINFRNKILKRGMRRSSDFNWDKAHFKTINFYNKIRSLKSD